CSDAPRLAHARRAQSSYPPTRVRDSRSPPAWQQFPPVLRCLLTPDIEPPTHGRTRPPPEPEGGALRCLSRRAAPPLVKPAAARGSVRRHRRRQRPRTGSATWPARGRALFLPCPGPLLVGKAPR